MIISSKGQNLEDELASWKNVLKWGFIIMANIHYKLSAWQALLRYFTCNNSFTTPRTPGGECLPGIYISQKEVLSCPRLQG